MVLFDIVGRYHRACYFARVRDSMLCVVQHWKRYIYDYITCQTTLFWPVATLNNNRTVKSFHVCLAAYDMYIIL